MQSRRHDEFMAGPPIPRDDSRKHRYELGPDQFPNSHRNARAGDRSPPPRSGTGRSSSPPRGVDGSRRVFVPEQRSGSIERRGEFGLHMGRGGRGGGRTDGARSPSPPFGQVQKRPQYDEEIVHRKYARSGHPDYDANDNIRSKQVYGYDHGASRMSKEQDHNGNRIAGVNAIEMVAQKTMAMEDGEVRESYRLSPGLCPNSNYGETGGHFQLSPTSMDMRQFEPEKSRYLESMPRDKLPVMEHYKADKSVLHLRDDPYTMPPASHFKDFANSSSGASRGKVMGVHRDDVPSWHLQDFPIRGKIGEPIGFDAYEQWSNIDSGVDPDVRQHNLLSYRRGAFSPTRVEHEDYFYPNSRGTANDDHGYTSGTIHRTMTPRGQLDYDHTPMDYDQRDVSRSSVMRPVLGRGETADDSCGNLRKGRMWDHALQKSTVPDYFDMNRTSNASKQRDEYLGSGSIHGDNGRRMPRDHEMIPMTISHDQQITHLRSDQGFGRDDNPGYQKERSLELSPRSRYEAQMHRLAVRRHRTQEEEELDTYEPVNRVLKRKYPAEENMRSHDSRSIMSSKWNVHRDYEDLRDCEEDWTHEDVRGIYPSRHMGYDYDDYGETERTHDGHHRHHKDYASDDLPPSRFSLGHTGRHYVRSYKHSNGNRCIKGYTRPSSYGWHNSNNLNRRSVYHKQHKVWKNSDDFHDDKHVNNVELLEDWDNAVRPGPPEDSEEFLKLVHEAFLKYYKKLNMNPAIRRRYLEQGKAGSLFCIVCGRSDSKEFMDTQRLGTHAFMSPKVGLREEHLGLLKAICVLLGWSVVPPDTITWVPQVLPDAEALAQKEDLILWPPLVIIHNISLSNRNLGEQKIVNAERLEAFLRGKGFVGGKIKVCPGVPGDESIMVVKFLGTFTGLENAERLHKYFAENKHGRIDVERLSSRGGSKRAGGLKGGDAAEEVVLYGYMGIVEDLEKLDYNTKKISLIESKKGIQDLANAPVKQEKS